MNQCGEHNKHCLFTKTRHIQCGPGKRGSLRRTDKQHCCHITEANIITSRNVASLMMVSWSRREDENEKAKVEILRFQDYLLYLQIPEFIWGRMQELMNTNRVGWPPLLKHYPGIRAHSMTESRCHLCCCLSFGSPGQEECNDIACRRVAEGESGMNTCIRFQGQHVKGAILVIRVHW